MFQKLAKWSSEQSVNKLLILTMLALLFHSAASILLNKSYAESQFPVPYHVAQLSFNPERIRYWYAYLINLGTMDLYLKTQHIDFLFIASVLALHPLALLLIGKLFASRSIWQNLMVSAAGLSIIAPLADALENLVTYVMLAQPATFSDWLAYLYSSLAAIKFAMFTFAYIAAALGVALGSILLIHVKYLRSRKSHQI